MCRCMCACSCGVCVRLRASIRVHLRVYNMFIHARIFPAISKYERGRGTKLACMRTHAIIFLLLFFFDCHSLTKLYFHS